jgi:hypothetical protein
MKLIIINRKPAEEQLGDQDKGNDNINGYHGIQSRRKVQPYHVGQAGCGEKDQPVGKEHALDFQDQVPDEYKGKGLNGRNNKQHKDL